MGPRPGSTSEWLCFPKQVIQLSAPLSLTGKLKVPDKPPGPTGPMHVRWSLPLMAISPRGKVWGWCHSLLFPRHGQLKTSLSS